MVGYRFDAARMSLPRPAKRGEGRGEGRSSRLHGRAHGFRARTQNLK